MSSRNGLRVMRPGGHLVVQRAGFEASVQDADEPVGELAQGGVVAAAAGSLPVSRAQVLERPRLRELYEDNLPIAEIAAMAGCATATIRRLLKHDGVPPRRTYRRPPPESGITRAWLCREYVDKLRS